MLRRSALLFKTINQSTKTKMPQRQFNGFTGIGPFKTMSVQGLQKNPFLFSKKIETFSPAVIMMFFNELDHYAMLPNRRELYNLETFLLGLGKMDITDHHHHDHSKEMEQELEVIRKINSKRIDFTIYLMLAKPDIFLFAREVAKIHEEVIKQSKNNTFPIYLNRMEKLLDAKIEAALIDCHDKFPEKNSKAMLDIRRTIEKKFGTDVVVSLPDSTMMEQVQQIKAQLKQARQPAKEFFKSFDLVSYLANSGIAAASSNEFSLKR